MSGIIVNMKTIAITGHRPESIPDEQWTKGAISHALNVLSPDRIIVGMAAGVDLWSAVLAHHLEIPWIAVRPWSGHAPRSDDTYMYNWVLKHAEEVVDITDKQVYPGAFIYHQRNEWMVDHADGVLAVWNEMGKGGTAACVKYANKVGKEVHIINPKLKASFARSVVVPPTEEDTTCYLPL